MVSTHSHLKVAEQLTENVPEALLVSTHSHLKVAEFRKEMRLGEPCDVSTHSHLKVAEQTISSVAAPRKRFNTQPPEGG